MNRRDFLIRSSAACLAGVAAPRCAMHSTRPAGADIGALALDDALNGGSDPVPIPWLDKNGSHNQSPAPGEEPSNIFHFKGAVARANDFTGMGTDQSGRRIAFGAKSTDFSFMQGEYFAGRRARQGTFSHI